MTLAGKQASDDISALLSYEGAPTLDFDTLLDDIAAELRRNGLPAGLVASRGKGSLTLTSDRVTIEIAKDAPFSDAVSINVSAASQDDAAMDDQLLACFLTAKRLAGAERPVRVFWNHTRTSYPAAPFLGEEVKPRRVTGAAARQQAQKVSTEPETTDGKAKGLDRGELKRARLRARDRLLAAKDNPMADPTKRLPAPDPNRLNNISAIRQILMAEAQAAPMRSPAVSYEAQIPDGQDAIHRLTVHAMNVILMIMVFPVGMAMLTFNLLGGENIRSTAHVMGLTGMGIALANAGLLNGMPLIG